MRKRQIGIIILLITSLTCFAQDFLHRDGQRIIDGSGNNVLLRGLGLGGWMLQEGYMLKTSNFAGPQYQIKQKISEMIGPDDTEKFYEAYRANGITKRDIDSLAAWGFNSVRLPMHYNLYTLPIELEKNKGEHTWIEEGFKMTDNLLEWCADNKVYLILDLHAAPGGQGNDANISDYDTTKPSLWESEENKEKMIALWRKLAERYKDSPWVGGYDIINEPNWNFTGKNKNGCDEESNAPLRDLMVRVTKAIREVDTNHIVIIEGNCWGNNYKGIFPLWDDNMVLSFHKYWSNNDTATIQYILDYRKEHDVPIWMGEGGENSNVWFTDAIHLFEINNIGWNFWPMKKIDNIAGITNVKMAPGYQELLEYWENPTNHSKPSKEFALKTLMRQAENYKIENVDIKYDVIDAMFRQVYSNETKAFTTHDVPGIIFATDYDLGRHEYAYHDTDVATYWVSTGERTEWNKGDKLRNDGVDIIECQDNITNGYCVSFINDGEWLQYTIEQPTDQVYDIEARHSGRSGKINIEINEQVQGSATLPSTGDKKWQTTIIKNIPLKKGINEIRVVFEQGNFDFNYLNFKKQQNIK